MLWNFNSLCSGIQNQSQNQEESLYAARTRTLETPSDSGSRFSGGSKIKELPDYQSLIRMNLFESWTIKTNMMMSSGLQTALDESAEPDQVQ